MQSLLASAAAATSVACLRRAAESGEGGGEDVALFSTVTSEPVLQLGFVLMPLPLVLRFSTKEEATSPDPTPPTLLSLDETLLFEPPTPLLPAGAASSSTILCTRRQTSRHLPADCWLLDSSGPLSSSPEEELL